MIPTLRRAAGDDKVVASSLITGAEDFAFYLESIPGLYLMLSVNDPGVASGESPANHSPFFDANEAA